MFYRNAIKTKKSQKVTFEKFLGQSKNGTYLNAENTYNFSLSDGTLKTEFGISKLKMPLNTTDLVTEKELVPHENPLALWSFSWYDITSKTIKYYLLYFTGSGTLYYDNLFYTRPLPCPEELGFTTIPVGIAYSYNGKDYMVFSSETDTRVFGEDINESLPDAPRLISLCAHENRLYAITATARRSLVYTNNLNLLEWRDSDSNKLSFSDERGNLTKIISFGDYLYVFREFGITKISTYSASREFSISHIFESSSYIYPGSIASDGENVYFMTTDGFYCFDGGNVKRIEIDFFNQFEAGVPNAVCFESKYYLACRMKFMDGEEGGINNAIFIYDIANKTTQIIRGVDVKQFVALKNRYKSKIALCFNGEHQDKLGEVCKGGGLFGTPFHSLWSSRFTDFGIEGSKKIANISLKASMNCLVTIQSDEEIKVVKVKAGDKRQTLGVKVVGTRFKITIESDEEGEISQFSLCVTN